MKRLLSGLLLLTAIAYEVGYLAQDAAPALSFSAHCTNCSQWVAPSNNMSDVAAHLEHQEFTPTDRGLPQRRAGGGTR
ncbi:MAG: hypothetical protein VKK04_09080 [Synechococcales bacterium]|nr:hypothetical protein [Synechococcales bacterium]